MVDDPEMKAAVTIYDVAAAAGVAPSTISRALARPGRVSAATAAKVRAAATGLVRPTSVAAGDSTVTNTPRPAAITR